MDGYRDPTTYGQPPSPVEANNDPMNQGYRDPTSYGQPADAQTPPDVTSASRYLGTDVDSGYCESFVEAATNGKNWGDSATSAWQSQLQAGMGIPDPSLQGAKAGDKVYFNDSSQPNGHVGILVDPQKGTFISAEPDGVKIDTLAHWLPYSGQSVAGFVPVDQ
jgi:hypothetical protein